MKIQIIFKILLLLAVSLTGLGCVSSINYPPHNYELTNHAKDSKISCSVDYETFRPRIVRAAFDQNGHLYPHNDQSDIPIPNWKTERTYKTHWKVSRFFELRHQNKDGIKKYKNEYEYEFTEKFIKPLYQDIANKIDKKLNDFNAEHLVVLIHGFKTSFEKASNHVYPCLYSKISDEKRDKSIFLEVYWEGRTAEIYQLGALFKVWGVSLTYSNLAGQIGLRNILNNISNKQNIELTYLTHSRGSGVAISSFSEPKWDDGQNLCVPTTIYKYKSDSNTKQSVLSGRLADKSCKDYYVRSTPSYDSFSHRYKLHHPPLIQEFKRVSLGMIAPAIGSGHINDNLGEFFKDKNLSIVYSQQPYDFALIKGLNIGDQIGGSDFGANDKEYVQYLQGLTHILACPITFKTGKLHKIESYYKDADATNLFFTLLDLNNKNQSSLIDDNCL